MHVKEWIGANVGPEDFIIITGSTSGIGHAYLREICKSKCKVICISNEANALEDQKKAIEKATDAKITNIFLDLRNVEETRKIADQLAKLPIKILINNAGFGLKGRFENQNVNDFIDIIAVNITAPVVLTRAILPQMQLQNCGLVIHLASINAVVPIPNNQVYTATKTFCASYALAVARENKNSKIIFQLVMPGTTRTPFHDRQGANPSKLVMMPEDVVETSLSNIKKHICIPNKADRILAIIVPFIPKNLAMDMAAYMLKKRLGV